jgi:hypothetical protein
VNKKTPGPPGCEAVRSSPSPTKKKKKKKERNIKKKKRKENSWSNSR